MASKEKCIVKPFTKDIALKTLDTINMWINTCDTKASIIIGIASIVATIIFSSDIMLTIKGIVNNIFADLKCCSCIFAITFLGSIICFLLGFAFLVSVIFPRLILTPVLHKEKSGHSKSRATYGTLMFYGLIAQMTFKEYLNEVSSYCDNQDRVMNDILFQIHSAACICNIKFKKFKIGILLFSIGIVAFALHLVLGYFLY